MAVNFYLLTTKWPLNSETGVEGSAITFGNITDTLAELTPFSLVVSSIPAANEALTLYSSAPTVGWSPGTASGVEGSAVTLGTISDTVNGLNGSNSLQSLVVSAIPVGARLTDGSHGFTAAVGSTAVDVADWNLSNLTITPASDANFTLTVAATEQDADGNTSSAAASEVVTVNPLPPTVAWLPTSATGSAGSAIALGTIRDIVNGLGGDSNSLQSLVVSAIPVGTTLGDGAHSFTAATGSTAVDVANWNLSGLTLTAATPMSFTLAVTATVQDAEGNTNNASTTEAVTVTAPGILTVTWSPGSETGVEGSAISLDTITETIAGLTPQSLVVSAIPIGARLTDDSHGFTAAAGSTSADVTGWSLSGLKITPANDTNFTLVVTATAQDAAGHLNSASATEAVTVNPLPPTVGWSPGSANGVEGSAIALGTISDTVNGLSGDSNSLQSLVVSAIPAGVTLADGAHSFTAGTGSTSVNVAGWNLSHLTMMAASAMTFTVTATATVRDAEGNTNSASASETVTAAALPAGSPPPAGGTPQHPNLFSGYAVRPSWQVAGVDYAVGVPSGTILKDPTTPGNLPTGATLDTINHLIKITADNVTLDGYDFSLHGGYNIYVQGAANTTITDCYFYGGVPVNIAPGSSNVTIAHNTIDGGGASGNLSFGELIYDNGQGVTVEYNWIKNAPQHFLTVNKGGVVIYDYNLLEDGGWGAGQHLNYLQFGGGTYSNPQVDYNTMVQHVTLAGGEGFQMYTNSTGSITNGEIGYNTLITIPNGGSMAESYIIHAGSNNQYPSPATGVVHDNYIDARGAYGVTYPGLSGFTYSNDINLVTGLHL